MATKKKAARKRPATKKKTTARKPKKGARKITGKVNPALKKVYSKAVITAAKRALKFPETGKTINIPKPLHVGSTLVTAKDLDVVIRRLDDIDKRVTNIEQTVTTVTVPTVNADVDAFSVRTAGDTAEPTLPPGVTLNDDGNVEIDTDETWRWTEADMLAFLKVATALEPPALDVHIGRPRKMRKVLFDWMREQGLEPTDLPPEGAEVPAVVAGFTGTRDGMTSKQSQVLRALLRKQGVTELHHGDCVGSDEDAHEIALQENVTVVVHPPAEDGLRAFVKGAATVLDPLPYHKRNHAIVDGKAMLFATPKSATEELKSGTWSTIRYAKKVSVRVFVINPDGKVTRA